MEMRFPRALCLLSVALALLAGCGDDGETTAQQAANPVQSETVDDVDVSPDGTTLILKYEDGSRLLISAVTYAETEEFTECFDEEPDEGPIVLSEEENPGVEELSDDVQVSLNLMPCST
jgi:hypothetical protein